jgi:hypothetical protein
MGGGGYAWCLSYLIVCVFRFRWFRSGWYVVIVGSVKRTSNFGIRYQKSGLGIRGVGWGPGIYT